MGSARNNSPHPDRDGGWTHPASPNGFYAHHTCSNVSAAPSQSLEAPARADAKISALRSVPLGVRPPDQQPKLLNRLSEALRTRHCSSRTEQTPRHWVNRFITFHNLRHPADTAEPEINASLAYPAVQEKVSASTQNHALSVLLYLYRHVLGRRIGDLGDVVRARRPIWFPIVLTRAEVEAILGHKPTALGAMMKRRG